jgi:putative transposase
VIRSSTTFAIWSDRTEIPTEQIVQWIGISLSKFHDWRKRYGKVNEHNGWIPRDWWLEDWEKQAIIEFHDKNLLEGYRGLTFMMLDADVVATSPSSVYRVLSDAGLMNRHNTKPSLKGTGFQQPLGPHEHWHVDIAYINVLGTFFFLCSLLDGYSRSIVHWEIRPKMEEGDVETIIQRALEQYPGVSPSEGGVFRNRCRWLIIGCS